MALKLILFCLPLLSLSAAYDWNDYYSLEETEEFLYNLSDANNLAVTSYYSIGRTSNGRDMMVFRIVFDEDGWLQSFGLKEKPAVLIEAGIYGNEWIAPAVATYIINRLVTTTDQKTLSLIQGFRWYVVPFSNPDGYDYSFTMDPMWRKNRTPFPNFCYGVDLNRNFHFHWNEDGSSRDPCSYVYAGPEAKSENETQTLVRLVDSIRNLKFYASLQGYGQKFVFPFGFTDDHKLNKFHLDRIGSSVTDNIKRSYGTKYTTGSLYHAIHQVSGNMMDWMSARGIKMAFTYKLRPAVDSAHAPSRRAPRTQILATAVEIYNSLIALAEEIKLDVILNTY